MKSYTVSALAALLPALVSAAPASCPAPAADTTFSLISIHSGNQYVHNQPVNANGGLFWIGKPTTTYCPAIAEPCPPGTQTALIGAVGGNGALSTSHEVPGQQAVYVQGAGSSTPGSLAFNGAHSSAPTGAIVDQFTLTETNLDYKGGNWLACPSQGAYYVTTVKDSEFCIGIALHVIPYTGPMPAAWQYV